MRALKNILFKIMPMLFAGSMIFSSCETPLDIEYLDFEPYPVVSFHGETDTTVDMRLTYSRWFLSEGDFVVVNNATANLTVNGTEKFPGTFDATAGRYSFGSYIPQPGDNVMLSVDIPDRETLEASCAVPSKPQTTALSIDTVSVYVDEYYSYIATQVAFVLHDNPDEENYYMLELFSENPNDGYNWWLTWFDIDDIALVDPMDLESVVEGDYMVSTNRFFFSDHSINGESHKIKMLATNHYDPYYHRLNVKLTGITKDEYLYYVSLYRQRDSDDIFSEPVQVHSNIENGIGIFSISSPHHMLFELNAAN